MKLSGCCEQLNCQPAEVQEERHCARGSELYNRTKEEMRSHDKNKRSEREESRRHRGRQSGRKKTMVLDCNVSELTEPTSCGSEEIFLVLYLRFC